MFPLDRKNEIYANLYMKNSKNKLYFYLKALSPAAGVLLCTIIYFFFWGDWDQAQGWVPALKAIMRFIKLAIFSCLSFLVLPYAGRFLFGVMRKSLVLIDAAGEYPITFLKYMVFRPLHGVGIGLLFSTKLLTLLQVISGSDTVSSGFFLQADFQLDKFVGIAFILFSVSLLLALVWALDDMNIRYYQRETVELKIVGKYFGNWIPFLLGAYGILKLFSSFSGWLALVYLLRILVVLYPVFAFFAVLHRYFIDSRPNVFFKKEELSKVRIKVL